MGPGAQTGASIHSDERLKKWDEAVGHWQAIEQHDTALSVMHYLLAGRCKEADVV